MASKQVIAKDIILNGSPTISVQVINEVSNNLLKKLQFQESEISSFIVNCYERYSVVNICFKFHIQTYSFDNSLSVDRFCNLQLESWLSSFNRLALVRCNNMALTCL